MHRSDIYLKRFGKSAIDKKYELVNVMRLYQRSFE